MLLEDYKETQEGAHSCLETTKKYISDPNTELTLLSNFFVTAQQSEQQHKQAPRGGGNTYLVHTHTQIHKIYQCYFPF